MPASPCAAAVRALIVGLGVVCATAGAAAAQPALARIDGAVTDTSGGALPGVAVTLTTAHGTTVTAFANEAGRFAFADVPGATARLTFELSGFETIAGDDIVLRPGAAVTVVRVLALSGVEESVDVVGVAPRVAPPPPVREPPPPITAVPEHEAASVCGPTTRDSSQVSVGEISGHRFEEDRALYTKGDELLLTGWRRAPSRSARTWSCGVASRSPRAHRRAPASPTPCTRPD